MQKVLVIGGQGFIGFHLIHTLKQRNYEVVIASRKLQNDAEFYGFPVIHFDLANFSDDAILSVLRDFQVVVFGGGADDRTMPKEDPKAFFYRENVVPCVKLATLGKQVQLEKLIILGSYFTYFNRMKPEWKMAERHPYVRSRVLQQEETIKAADNQVKVEILELPYIFGSAPNMIPLWKPLVKYINATPWVFYTRGGTAMIGVEEVANAIVGAIEYRGSNSIWQIGAENHTWAAMIALFGEALGKKRKTVILPTTLVRFFSWLTRLFFKITGKKSGLDIYHFISTQTAQTYLDTNESMRELQYDQGDMKKSIKETVRASGF